MLRGTFFKFLLDELMGLSTPINPDFFGLPREGSNANRLRIGTLPDVSSRNQIESNRREIGRYRTNIQDLNRRIDELVIQLQEQPLVVAARRSRPLPLQGNNIGVFGLTSTGKSTLVNSLLGQQVARTGGSETTTEIASYPGLGYVLWDLPGRNDTVSYENDGTMALMKGLSHRIVLIEATVKENRKLLRLLDDLDLDYHIVVNKLDHYDTDEQKDLRNAILNEVQELGLKGSKCVFFISAKYPNRFPDWLKMVNYLTH